MYEKCIYKHFAKRRKKSNNEVHKKYSSWVCKRNLSDVCFL